jgi:hypothetical protein
MSNKIDLSKCVVGQKCVRRDGTVVEFIGMSGFARYPYNCECGAYTRDGKWSVLCCANDRDIIAVLPLEESKAEVHVHIHHYHVSHLSSGENMPLQPAPVPSVDRSPEKQAERMAWVAANATDIREVDYRWFAINRRGCETDRYPTPEEAIDAAMAGKWED